MREYNRNNIPLAKLLRSNMTPWERRLWYEFLRIYPIRFQRQKAIGNYIADFYCAKARLVVELDGSGHYTEEKRSKDALRTKELEQRGVTVLRFCNTDVDKRFRGVCEAIDLAVKRSLPPSKIKDF
ncbi:MAG: endonuclease domain-containing protein [Clostridia bacterium]|nr:endonuclease domain-containing protein [Clostridia bacterium]